MSRIRANQITNQSADGAPTVQNGLVISGVTTSTNVSVASSVTATTYYGSGANLTNITSTTINNNANNRLITGSGTANTLEGEANLTFDGDDLLIRSSTDGRRISFATDGTSHYMKYDNTLSGIILNGYGGIAFETYGSNERLRLTSAGDLLFKKTSSDDQVTGVQFDHHGLVRFTKDNIVAYFIRTGSDGQMIRFYGDTTSEGSINISGTSISYNGGVLSRWSQIVGISTNNKADRPTIYQGTVMSNLDEMCEWGDEENMQLNKTQVSNVSGDKNVAGVFWAWDDDDDTYLNDYYIAQTGDYIIRVGAATTVTRGDLLESAGDGTAKPQSDDIVRSKTVAKVTSGIAHTTYPDGTKTYPCVLMAS